MITIASIKFIEIIPLAHGISPWRDSTIPLLLRTLKKNESTFNNYFAYHGRDSKDYRISIDIRCETLVSISGQIEFDTSHPSIILPSIALNYEGDKYYSGSWLNIIMPGSGPTKIITTLISEP